MRIEHFFEDGANFQAQIVALIIKNHREEILDASYDKKHHEFMATLNIGRLENCREQGYVFSLRYGIEQLNLAVYEHRNIDSLCVLEKEMFTLNTPTLDDMWMGKKDKYDYDKDFKVGCWKECAEWIIDKFKKFLEFKMSLERE